MIRTTARRCAIAFAAWFPFFAAWVSFAASASKDPFSTVLFVSFVMLGSAGLLGIAVWKVCQRYPWPLEFSLRFYLMQILFAIIYAIAWGLSVFSFEDLRGALPPGMWTIPNFARQAYLGLWFYAIFAGIFYAVQTRNRLHEKEVLAGKARLDAIHARLNPHFLFNALHTLSALVKFRPTLAEGAVERLGDMLRYTLKEDGRDLVEFSEEYDFTRKYLAFEQLRYEDRLKVDMQIDPESFHFEIPPFALQTLAENAVHHAISVRPEGGSIWIKSSVHDGQLRLQVRDDGPGGSPDDSSSHQFGLRALRERLQAAYGPAADLRTRSDAVGFEATVTLPSRNGSHA